MKNLIFLVIVTSLCIGIYTSTYVFEILSANIGQVCFIILLIIVLILRKKLDINFFECKLRNK